MGCSQGEDVGPGCHRWKAWLGLADPLPTWFTWQEARKVGFSIGLRDCPCNRALGSPRLMIWERRRGGSHSSFDVLLSNVTGHHLCQILHPSLHSLEANDQLQPPLGGGDEARSMEGWSTKKSVDVFLNHHRSLLIHFFWPHEVGESHS